MNEQEEMGVAGSNGRFRPKTITVKMKQKERELEKSVRGKGRESTT